MTPARPAADERRRARWVIGGFAVVLLVAVAPFAPGLLGAAVLAVLCGPLHRRLRARIGPGASALLLSVAALLLVLAPAVALSIAALGEAPDALRRLTASLADLRRLTVGPFDLGAQLTRVGDALLGWASSRAMALVGGVTRALLNLCIAVVGLYTLLRSGPALWTWLRPAIPFSDAGTEHLRARFVDVTEATLLGVLATATTQGLVVGALFAAVGLPNALVWGVLTGIVSVLPILGSALVWGPGSLVLAAQQRYGAAALVAIVGVVVASNIDNVVRPLVYRRVSDIHPLVTLLGAFAGVNLMGAAGLLLGPLAITYFLELVNLYRAEYGEPVAPCRASPDARAPGDRQTGRAPVASLEP